MKSNYLASFLPFYIFVGFGAGIVLGHNLAHFFIFFSAAVISLVLGYIFYKKNKIILSDILIFVFFFFVGGTWQTSANRSIEPFLSKESTFVIKVVSLPSQHQLRNTLYAQIEEIDNTPAQTRIKVIDYTRSLEYLSSYQVKARLGKRKYQNKDFYSLWIKKNGLLRELPPGLYERLRKRVSQYLLKVFKDNVDGSAARFLGAVFLGRRELLGNETELFSRAGVSHLLAISGLHIGLTAAILFFILRIFCVSFRKSLIISVFFLYFYALLTGSSPATVRAVIMYSVFALSFLIKRKVNIFNTLGLAGIIILLIEPMSVLEIGFQLSFLSVFSILVGYRIFSFRTLKIPSLEYAKNIFLVSLYVMIGITPLISYYFERVYFLSFLYNVILIPIFTFILALNFLLIIFSPFSLIASSLGSILSILISFFVKVVSFLGSLSGSFVSFRFSALMIRGYYMFLATILIALKTEFGRKTLKNIKVRLSKKSIILPQIRG